MAYYADQMRSVLTRRAGDWLARNAWPHFTMVAAFALSIWAAYASSHLTEGWGGLALRCCVNFLAAYASFVLCLAIWLFTKPSLDRASLLEGASEFVETRDPWDDEAVESREKTIDQFMRSSQDQARGQGPNAWIALGILVLVVGTLFVVAHMLRHARWYLGSLMTLGGKIRHRAIEQPSTLSCLFAPVRLTGWTALILALHYVLLGLLLQWAFPQAVTVADVIRQMR